MVAYSFTGVCIFPETSWAKLKREEIKQPMDNDLEITTVKTIEEIENIRSLWEEIQGRQSRLVPNADIDRYLTVLQAQKDEMRPYVMVFTQNGLTVGMVVGRIEMHRLRCRIGYKVVYNPSLRCLTIVYGGILGEQNEAVCTKIVSELQSVLQSGEIDMVHFSQLETDLPIYRLLTSTPNFLCRSHFPIVQSHRSMSIPESMDIFYKSCSKKHRGNLRRYIRRIEKEYPEQVRVVRYSSEQELEDVVNAAARISSKTYQNAMGKGLEDNPKTLSLMETSAKSGWLRTHILFVAEEPCAFQIGLQYGRTYFLEQIGYDPDWKQYNVGTVLFLRVLENLCGNPQIDLIDFGFGDADYKQQYGDKTWPEASVYIVAPRIYPIFVNLAQCIIRATHILLSYLATRTGIYQWVKRTWRVVLQQKSVKSTNQIRK